MCDGDDVHGGHVGGHGSDKGSDQGDDFLCDGDGGHVGGDGGDESGDGGDEGGDRGVERLQKCNIISVSVSVSVRDDSLPETRKAGSLPPSGEENLTSHSSRFLSLQSQSHN